MTTGSDRAHYLTREDYVHLHNHTEYSLLDGLTRITELLDFVQSQGMKAVAMTDHGTLSGAIEFYKEAKARELKAIIGIETYVATRKHTDKDPQKDKQRFHLILLAMNNVGYKNLMKLSSKANLDGFYYHPRVDHDLLEQHSEGIIALSACMGGEVGSALKNNDYKAAKETASWYKKVFGDRYYLEVQDHGHPKNPMTNKQQQTINEQVLKLGKDLEISVVVTCDAHYLRHEDQEAHEVLLCVGTGSYVSDEKRMSLKEYPLHVVPPQEMIERWGNSHPELIKNTKAIADLCNVEIDLGNILIPKFDVPKGHTEKTYLDELVYNGLLVRYGKETEATYSTDLTAIKKKLAKDVIDRAEYELGIIDQMGFNGYFLIIWDFIAWGKAQGIVFGPGRGSAAGSIIAYSLRITELDPLAYDLLFERFLNPDRISMPDIDIDIQDTRRDEVIQYCVEKYGKNRVANIVTFGRMFARNAVRDVSRVLEVPYAEADKLAKMIPPPVQGRHIPLEKSLIENADLKHEYETNPVAKTVFDQAVRLEGTVRSHGVHAAGVVIAPDDIVEFVPLEMAQKGVITTQYPMNPIEELGLIKMDFLGLSNLTIIKNALRIVKRVYSADVDINTIPLDDKKTFELLQRGDTTGVFQFESSGMKRYLQELKPTAFEDIVAMGALYRPGPLGAGLTDSFIKRKNGLEPVSYAHPLMKDALGTTFGVLVYQEQVMQISRDVCGFSGGEADTLRKAIGKKKLDVMQKMQVKFVDGAVERGVPKEVIEKFWKDLLGFADYCFNKSHSACYGLISYQTAYLKAHYPAAFMAALMTSDYDDTDRLAVEISECKHMGIEVLPPDVNESFVEFAVVPDKNQIRFGMNAIKNVGTGAVEEIIRAREAKPFNALEDFFKNVSTRIVNKKSLESLIKAGAFDRFEARSKLYNNIDGLLAYAQRIQKERLSGQTDLFGNDTSDTHAQPTMKLDNTGIDIPKREQLLWERELLGLYLSEHPLASFKDILEEQAVPIADLKTQHQNKRVPVGGAIQEFREITTKKGQKMGFAKIEDASGEAELVLFPGIYQQTIGIWERDRVVLVKAKVDSLDREGNQTDEIKLIVDDAREITHDQADHYQVTGKKKKTPKVSVTARMTQPKPASTTSPTQTGDSMPKRVYIRIENSSNQAVLLSLKEVLDTHKGDIEVVFVLGASASKQIVKLPMKLDPTEAVLSSLAEIAGSDNVKLH
ncbi:DNA polymerase III subunit alpha [soil metagenome]